jgi:hypothetical protein
MPKLFGIIVWNESDADLATPMPYCESRKPDEFNPMRMFNAPAAMRNYRSLVMADMAAETFEILHPGMQARVISLDSVHK